MKKSWPLLLLFLLVLAGLGYVFLPQPNQPEETMVLAGNSQLADPAVSGPAMPAYQSLTPAEAYQLMTDNRGLVVIDVSPLWADGHLPGAVNYPIGDGSLDEAIPMLDTQADYLVYCHSDSATILGAQKLIDAGFKNVYRLIGNYTGWVEAGYEIET